MTTTCIYHNPRCSKSRQTLQLLRDQGTEPEIREYLKQPPSVEELEQIARLLGLAPRQFMRLQETAAIENGLSADSTHSNQQCLELIASHPILLERPIVVHNGAARIGRPPEAVLDLLR